ncbi:uncharacterized protein PV06_10370 [Exophiala oligosperma]|uniref:Uncharacterized protein n=2 Tax=Chaetothyriales TaxID=34395 RepID=A0A0D2D4Q3_9EURO|nr:uncharacterized protein PV06_10370 [Exophiala oligosperma]KAJ9646885.1 hypothetical protein H2204_000577 [Knufia peltigerae]KIW37320.1 hypothetical protein PV06_10370 [Exophiala oligosperma]
MRKPSIPDLIYQKTFPKPKQGDPGSFFAHIHRHIVSEIRVEVQTFFGTIDTLEAQYPGLDYTYPPHRRRLTRHPWHRRLFRVIDELGLTNDEVLSLCQWEGTRAAKERYEREAQTEVKSTIGADIEVAPQGNGPRAIWEDWSRPQSSRTSSDNDTVIELEEGEHKDGSPESRHGSTEPPDDDVMGLVRDAMQARMEARPSGTPLIINQVWEQWLKEALERHEMDVDSVLTAIQSLDFEMISPVVEEDAAVGLTPATTPPLSPSRPARTAHTRNSYDDLHSMVDELQSNNTRLAEDNAAMALFLQRSQTEAAR